VKISIAISMRSQKRAATGGCPYGWDGAWSFVGASSCACLMFRFVFDPDPSKNKNPNQSAGVFRYPTNLK